MGRGSGSLHATDRTDRIIGYWRCVSTRFDRPVLDCVAASGDRVNSDCSAAFVSPKTETTGFGSDTAPVTDTSDDKSFSRCLAGVVAVLLGDCSSPPPPPLPLPPADAGLFCGAKIEPGPCVLWVRPDTNPLTTGPPPPPYPLLLRSEPAVLGLVVILQHTTESDRECRQAVANEK